MKYRFLNKELHFELRDEADESVFREVFLDRDYRLVERKILEAKSAIIDIGAHAGLFSLYAGVLNSSVSIFAYEPDEENFALLKKHLALNNVKNVFLKNVAVGAETGVRDFYLSGDSHNHSLFAGEGALMKRVNVVSLKDIFAKDLRKRGVEFCDLLKMDCEGAEFEIVRSVDVDLWKRIKAIYLEYHQYAPEMRVEEIVKVLRGVGYKERIKKSSYDKRMGFVFAEL